jgi:hypothetical protein
MKTIKQVEIEPFFIDGYMPVFETMEENKIYISEQFSTSIHKCLCGCGEKTVLPLDPVHGWNLIKHENGKVSFTPSVGNFHIPCKSHYIITNNKANFV